MTGIKDVAREVGVSTATVSRALRGLPRVSPDTRERVLEVANRMGYVASPHAASLASGQTHAIGVVVPNVTRWFFGSVVHGAEELLREEGYDLLLYTVTGEPAARQRLFSTYLLSKRVDAVMVLALRPTPGGGGLARTDRGTDRGGRWRGTGLVERAHRRRRDGCQAPASGGAGPQAHRPSRRRTRP